MATLTGKMLLNRYRVDDFIGRGGMAEVYKVWDAQRMTFLAMKVLHQDLATDKIFIRRFQREARTLSKLQHPNIVRFYDFAQEGRIAFMLLDYVDGEVLKLKIFDADKPFSAQETRQIIRPVISALQFAHSQGMVHCDIKPGNIMINKHGQVMLADFGISRMSDAATATMVGMGTPAYMAPEQARGLDPVHQTDIYALGIVLFELLAGGERPFTGESANTTGSTSERVRWEQINLPPPSPCKWNSEITPELEAVVMKCLEKDPLARYQTPLELLNALQLVLPEVDSQPLVTATEQVVPSSEKSSAAPRPQAEDHQSPALSKAEEPALNRHMAPWLLAGAMAVVALGVLLFSGEGKTDPLAVTQTALAVQLTQTAMAFAALPINTSTLTETTHDITATATNSDGTSPASGALSVTVDATAPAAPGTPDLAAGSDTGRSNTDNITSDTTPQFTGTCLDGMTVTITSSSDGNLSPNGSCSGDSYVITLTSALSQDSHDFTATQADAAGNSSSASGILEVKIVTPALSVSVSGNVGADAVSSSGGTPLEGPTNCSTTRCDTYFFLDDSVTLSATVDAASSFSGWGGDCAAFGVNLTGVLTMNDNKNCTATFAALTYPEMDVEGNAASIADGDNTPDGSDLTNFAYVTVGGNLEHIFRIQNEGANTLVLTEFPTAVTLSGSGDFSIQAQPSAGTIAAGGGDLTFVVRCTPSSVATVTTAVSIVNNDSNENPYDFVLSCTGMAAPVQEMDVEGNGV